MNYGERREAFFGTKWERRAHKRTYPLIKAAAHQAGLNAYGRGLHNGYYFTESLIIETNIAVIGGAMETSAAMINEVNKEVGESRKILEELMNDINKINDPLQLKLMGMVKDIRNSRQTISVELQTALKIMKDVRAFFLEKQYEVEMERLEKFVNLGERMRMLIQDGTMEAVCDIALKLAVGKEG